MEPFERDVLIDPTVKREPVDLGPDYFPKFRTRVGLTFTMLGFLIFMIGLRPDLFGLDNAQSIGFAQIMTILIGLAFMTFGASYTLNAFWVGSKKTIVADFGNRVVATGYVICAFTALADAFGFGTNPFPNVFLGTLQSRGLMIGIVIICAGLIMLIKFKGISCES